MTGCCKDAGFRFRGVMVQNSGLSGFRSLVDSVSHLMYAVRFPQAPNQKRLVPGGSPGTTWCSGLRMLDFRLEFGSWVKLERY